MSKSAPPLAAPRALLFNRQFVRWIELDTPHEVSHYPNGWRIELRRAASVAFHLEQGEVIKVSLGGSDYLQCAGDHIYVGMGTGKLPAEEPAEPADPADPNPRDPADSRPSKGG